ncbi:methyltransferase domain-containing protein [Polynucleobacter paneuropaeus]|nr:methyltransferase domain-containing protein [Polynucleobacter paneuropaeus]QWD21467.1 methyltransferase domain-containing protein [Polynucleobacter paneuropaeus]
MIGANLNETLRRGWLEQTLAAVPSGLKILDAGAGELQNKPLCKHLNYVSQDVCKYEGSGNSKGLHMGTWNTEGIDIVSDIANIPVEDASFDVVLCSEVFEHLPNPLLALDEFSRLLKPGGRLIITAPFASLVHFAPYFYATGFSSYWYDYHLTEKGFRVDELQPNGDWFSCLKQELLRLPKMVKNTGSVLWPFSYVVTLMGVTYISVLKKTKSSSEIACFGWHCIATKL